jgi:hypothetical protein
MNDRESEGMIVIGHYVLMTTEKGANIPNCEIQGVCDTEY